MGRLKVALVSLDEEDLPDWVSEADIHLNPVDHPCRSPKGSMNDMLIRMGQTILKIIEASGPAS